MSNYAEKQWKLRFSLCYYDFVNLATPGINKKHKLLGTIVRDFFS